MRRILPAIVVALLLAACNKNEQREHLLPNASVTGSWKWQSGNTGWSPVFPSPDSVIIIRFSADSLYSINLNGQVQLQGQYNSFYDTSSKLVILQTDKRMKIGEFVWRGNEQINFLNKDTVVFNDYSIADGYSNTFLRIN